MLLVSGVVFSAPASVVLALWQALNNIAAPIRAIDNDLFIVSVC